MEPVRSSKKHILAVYSFSCLWDAELTVLSLVADAAQRKSLSMSSNESKLDSDFSDFSEIQDMLEDEDVGPEMLGVSMARPLELFDAGLSEVPAAEEEVRAPLVRSIARPLELADEGFKGDSRVVTLLVDADGVVFSPLLRASSRARPLELLAFRVNSDIMVSDW
jgi:hypothetical protein